jgi:hypothetical protein
VPVDETLGAFGECLARIIGPVSSRRRCPQTRPVTTMMKETTRILALAGDKVADDAFTIRYVRLGLDVGTAESAKILDYEVGGGATT